MSDPVDADVNMSNPPPPEFQEPEEEVFGVVNPEAIVSAQPVVGRRGRKATKRQSEDSDSDEAYNESEDDEEDEDSDEYEESEEEEESDDEYDDDDYDDDDDGEEYGRNRKHKGSRGRSSMSYQPARVIRQPQLPPVMAALTEKILQQRQSVQAAPAAGAGPALTAAQLQEMARNAVSSLAGGASPAESTLQPIAPRDPEATDSIRQHVSQELKQNIANMLMNPELRAALIAKLQANKASSPSIAPRPTYGTNFINYAGPGQRYASAVPDEGSSGATIAATRARRNTRQVDYKSYFNEDAGEDDDFEADEDLPAASSPKAKTSNSVTPNGKRRGRPPKNASSAASASASPTKKTKERHMYDEGSDSDEYDDVDSQASNESREPGIEKIMSHRVRAGKDEFYVKFHNLAYIHCEWVSRDEIAAESGGASRISRFLNKPLSYHHFDDKNIFNPEFTQIDRIVHGWNHPDPDNERKTTTSYLVKWRGLPIDQSTWEKKETVAELPDGPDAIKEYEAIPDPWKKRDRALAVGRRPDPSQWSRLTESPVYKSDNTLRPYQLEGLNWLVYCWMHKQSSIIADEMGLGKTVQSVSFLDLIYNRFNVRGPFIVIAPLSTLPHWQREFEAWTNLRVLLYHGTEAARDVMFEYEFFYKDPKTDQIIPGLCKFDVILTTYEMTLSGQHHLRNIIWRVGIFDEAHRLKNKASKAAEVLQMFQFEHKVLLTGTPIQNSLEELYSLLNFLQPHRFYSLEVFLKEYGNMKRSEDVERLQALLKPLMLRRLKDDVEKSIPVKEETIIEVELTSIQKRYYRAILEKNFGFLMKGAKSNNMPNLINTMMELRKCCIHPFLIKGAEERIMAENEAHEHDAQMECMIHASGKLVLVDKLLKKLREGGHKVLIFSQMTRCLDILSDYLRWRNYPHERIDGAIRGEDRQAAIDRFCDPNSDSFVFLLCTKAGGVGINLTAADTVVIFDSDWNPQNDLQAQARCHRIGQTKAVKIYRLITRNTYEREMFDRAGMKLGLDKAILQKMGPESSNLEDLSESGAAPQLSKTQVEDLLKKGAYGILMENDEAETKFLNEDIDSILERRTTVIKHDSGSGESKSAMDGSIFSKASFAATADDLDLDMDDPNFWELWAKKMNVDPRQVQSGAVAASVDESRIKRVLRRLQTHSKSDYSELLNAFPCALSPAEDGKETVPAEGEPILWTNEERSALIRLIIRFGLSRFETIRPYFPNRSQNDLLAATKLILKYCIEQVGEEEPKFKEDSEKLLLSKIEFARYDKKSSRQAALEAEDESSAPQSAGEFSKADMPYSGATRKQILEYRSFFRDESQCPEEFRECVRDNSRNILIVLQVVEMLRTTIEELGGGAAGESAVEAVAALTIPNSAGNGPTDWWGRDEDLALLVGTIRYGFGEFDQIKHDSSLSWHHQLENDFPEDARLFERIFKVVIAIEKRNRASAKLAAHSMNFGSGRRRNAFEDDEEFTGRRRRGRDEDEDEEYEAPAEEKRGRGRPKRRQVFSGPTARFLATWSKPQRAEFNRLISTYGLPPKREGSDDSYDWAVFRELLLPTGTASPAASDDEDGDDEESGEATDGSAGLSAKTDDDFDQYCKIYLDSCKYSSERPSRRRGRPSKSGKIVDEDEDDFEDDFEMEDFEGRKSSVPADAIIEMAPERAKKSLGRIELFNRLRSPAIQERENVAELLAGARRSGGLPRWWVIGEHDEALLQGASEYGFGRPDLLVKYVEKFKTIYEQTVSGESTVRESRRKAAPGEVSGENASGKYAVVDGIDVAKISWPNELIILRRLELIVEMLESEKAASPAKAKRGKKSRKTDEEEDDEQMNPDEDELALSAAKKRTTKSKASPKKTKKPAAKKEKIESKPASPSKRTSARARMPEPDEFPVANPGRRQKTLTDFGFGKK